MMTPYPLYKAPHLEPALVQLHNRLLSRCPAWHSPFGSGRAAWEVLGSPAAFTSAVELDISLGDAGWKVFLSDASCILRHEAFASHQGFEVESLPHEVQKAVLASLLAPALSLLQAAKIYWESLPCGYEGKKFYHISTDEVYGALELSHPEGIEPPFTTVASSGEHHLAYGKDFF